MKRNACRHIASYLTLLINLSAAPQSAKLLLEANHTHTHTTTPTRRQRGKQPPSELFRLPVKRKATSFFSGKFNTVAGHAQGASWHVRCTLFKRTRIPTRRKHHMEKGSRKMLRLKCDLFPWHDGSSQLCCGLSIAIFFLQRYRVNSIVGFLLQSFSCSGIESTLLWVLYCIFPAAK